MKNLKKLLAFAIVLVMMLAMCAPVMAADDTTTTINIEIKRDGSYGSSATGNREYTWYKVFSAVPADALLGKEGGHNDTGAPGDINYGDNVPAVAYVATTAVAAKLGSWNSETKTWTKAEGNLWFELSPIVGQTTYNVKWVNTSTDSATAQAAAKWLLENNVYEATGTLTPNDDGTKWTASGLDKGYYLISGSEGLNLVAATTDASDPHLDDGSIRFHEHMGYREAGRLSRCGYKFDRWYDLVFMELDIADHTSPAPARHAFAR